MINSLENDRLWQALLSCLAQKVNIRLNKDHTFRLDYPKEATFKVLDTNKPNKKGRSNEQPFLVFSEVNRNSLYSNRLLFTLLEILN